MNIKRILRLIALALLIALACVLPVPLNFYRKDNPPKFKIEQLDNKDDDTKKGDIKQVF